MRLLLLSLGWIFAATAVAGLLLPLLPCTPFALLSAACFGRSSPAARKWLLESRWLGPVIEDWRRHRAFGWGTKFRLLIIPAIGAIAALVLQTHPTTTLIALIVAGISAVVILALPTRRDAIPSQSATA